MIELPVVAEQEVGAESEVDGVGLLEGTSQGEVILVSHPLVGQVVGIDAKVRGIGSDARIAREAVLDPSVRLERSVLQSQGSLEDSRQLLSRDGFADFSDGGDDGRDGEV